MWSDEYISISNSFLVDIHPRYYQPGINLADIIILPMYSRLEINQPVDEVWGIQAFFPVSLLYLVGILAVSSCTRNFRHRAFRYTILTGSDAGIKE